jgi:hypothetical protein
VQHHTSHPKYANNSIQRTAVRHSKVRYPFEAPKCRAMAKIHPKKIGAKKIKVRPQSKSAPAVVAVALPSTIALGAG